ncbi:hypothetical protein [Stomatohabitans albus]|uniref:hypothetical protein n=1 Tax=Stomatohabitans albus TaxID=3110766 RepID=UPI00300CAB74
MNTTVGVILNQGQVTERTMTCLKLITRMLERGVHVRVYAIDNATHHTSGSTPFARAVTELIRSGGGRGALTWLVDEASAECFGLCENQTKGVVLGSASDLWNIVTASDLVLTLGVDA